MTAQRTALHALFLCLILTTLAGCAMAGPARLYPDVTQLHFGHEATRHPDAVPFRELIIGNAGTVRYDLRDTGFTIDVRNMKGPRVAEGTIFFSVREPASYEIHGHFRRAGLDQLEFGLDLHNMTDDAVLFRSYQVSDDGPYDLTFALGGEAGDARNIATGDQWGELEPGVEYRLRYRMHAGRRMSAGRVLISLKSLGCE